MNAVPVETRARFKFDFYMLDVHLTNRCNLHCDGCNHWSNYSLSGLFSNATLRAWAEPWTEKVSPRRINLLGGEPFLNKEYPEIIATYRSLFPDSTLKIFTNGFLLSKQHGLHECLKENNAILIVTDHSRDPRYRGKLDKELSTIASWGERRLKKETWFRKVYDLNGVEVEIRDMKGHWYKTYTGNGVNARPYKDNNPRKSWEECVSKNSVQLYQGKLYKCGTIAYLNDFLEKFELREHPDWAGYCNYQALSPECTDGELKQFLLREEEEICRMCPAHPEKVSDKEVFVIKKA